MEWLADPQIWISFAVLVMLFLLLMGFTLIVEGMHHHIPKGYIYLAMAFSVFVEMLNMKLRKERGTPVQLHERYSESTGD